MRRPIPRVRLAGLLLVGVLVAAMSVTVPPAADAAEYGTITGRMVAVDILGRPVDTPLYVQTVPDTGGIEAPGGIQATLHDDGTYSVRLPVGTYTSIRFINKFDMYDETCRPMYLQPTTGPGAGTLPLTVTADETTRIDITFDPIGVYRLQGTVTDSDGRPLSGSTVRLIRDFVGLCDEAVTDSNGRYAVEVHAGRAYGLAVESTSARVPPTYFYGGGFYENTYPITVTTASAQQLDVVVPTLAELGTVRVRLRKLDNSRYPGRDLAIYRRIGTTWRYVQGGTTSGYGNVALPVDPGRYRISFSREQNRAWERLFADEVCGEEAGRTYTVGRGGEVFLDMMVSPGEMCARTNATVSDTTPRVGQVLRIGEPRWVSNPSIRAYRWYRDETPISGAIHPSYRVSAADVGRRLYVREKANNPSARTGTTVSARTSIVTR